MGPYHPANLAPACSVCNLMKGFRRVRGYVEACRHIATHRGGFDFGRYPRRFRDNVSKRSRSCYISASSTHTKTHALSNEAFNRIVAQDCRYCGKASDPPTHHNGLDRLDSDVRVYNEQTCVSCCGDCNVMKYKWSEAEFIAHCTRVAEFNVGRDAFEGDVEGDDADEEPDAEADAAAAVDDAASDAVGEADEAAGEPAGEAAGAGDEAANPFADFAFHGHGAP